MPAVYQKAWTDETGRVAVRRRDKSRPFVAAIDNVGAESWLYGRGDDATARERMFGQLEGDWPRLRDTLIAAGNLQSEDRDAVALFAALQLMRTPPSTSRRDFVASVAEFTDERPISRETVRRYLAEKHLGFAPDVSEVEGAWTLVAYVMDNGGPPTSDETFSMALDAVVKELAPRLCSMTWTIETCRKPILFTSDRPVMCWRRRTPRDQFEGIGIDNADEIRFPLGPQNLLVIARRPVRETPVRVEPKRFVQVNADIAAQCFEFIIARRNRVNDLASLQLANRLPVLRFNVGPGVNMTPDGREESMGDLLHTWVPVRET